MWPFSNKLGTFSYATNADGSVTISKESWEQFVKMLREAGVVLEVTGKSVVKK
jgi:hypothetical protein